MPGSGPFDVLVIGSGASGLAAAVSAEKTGARVALAAKGSIQSCNSAKAQGGIQAAFGEDDSPEQHAQDIWASSHETANMELVEILTSEAPSAIHWLEELGVEFTRENGGYRLARCGGATRGYGAVLLNADGEEFTDSLGPRDVVSQAIVDEVAKGKGVETPDGRPAVYLDTTRIAREDAEISLPYMLRRYRAAGVDPLAEQILTYPVLHYQNGGLVIDTDAKTTLDGVYACGEIAGGTHGRNRMMGNSLLECVVFGRRAGRAAATAAGYRPGARSP